MVKADDVAGAGKGFFTEAGQLKSKKSLQIEESKSSKSTAATEVDTSGSSANLDKALGQMRTEFHEKAGRVITDVNQNLDDIKSAQNIVKAEKAAAKDLKAAIKDGDTEKADAARAQIQKLEDRRAKLAENISANAAEQKPRSRTSFNIGSEQKGTIEVRQVDFKAAAVDAAELDKKKDINAFIDELDKEAESLQAQRLDQRETRAQIKEIVTEVDTKLQAISDNAVRRFEDAENLANKLNSEIKAGAQEALAAFTSPSQAVLSALFES